MKFGKSTRGGNNEEPLDLRRGLDAVVPGRPLGVR
eukprot:CAMPEP_0204001746 /NCGR_PEP_ID=MMETSP0360-20130528/16414_1 /ASSEMBLY_ACC=CAM_ASM_000342 /TAXON_ID=268821 /ORGANISM="Scrippsiella Hangoei, Strain SHTV-5" /LENGTH=34 /DNA_ID= /DNA_START= /DNA_END= /DNA_ORIENTATION=